MTLMMKTVGGERTSTEPHDEIGDERLLNMGRMTANHILFLFHLTDAVQRYVPEVG